MLDGPINARAVAFSTLTFARSMFGFWVNFESLPFIFEKHIFTYFFCPFELLGVFFSLVLRIRWTGTTGDTSRFVCCHFCLRLMGSIPDICLACMHPTMKYLASPCEPIQRV